MGDAATGLAHEGVIVVVGDRGGVSAACSQERNKQALCPRIDTILTFTL